MGITELFLIAVGLSMDAFAVAVCMGLSLQKAGLRQMFTVGLYFGGFQAMMPLLGYLIGRSFAEQISAYDHWLSFVLLGIIGVNMIRESRQKDDEEQEHDGAVLAPKRMLTAAVATSIDALIVGVSFAFLNAQIAPAVSLIGVTTLLLSMLGVKMGQRFGCRYKARAELAGGIILILIGSKVLLEHLGILTL